MAKKDAPAEEKIFTIPLRLSWKSSSRVEKTKKSVFAVKGFVKKHTHTSDVKISQKLNDVLWTSGAQKPLSRVSVKVNVQDGIANVRLPEETTLEEEKRKFLEEKNRKRQAEKTPEAEAGQNPEPAKSEPDAKDSAQQQTEEPKQDVSATESKQEVKKEEQKSEPKT